MDNLTADGGTPATDASQPGSGPDASQQPQAPRVELDESEMVANYANFCRVTGTPEELIIDFGVNPRPMDPSAEPIVVTQRIVTNLYTAKRLMNVLQLTIQRHEAAFGAVETDVQRRVRRA
jgi:hypothetical protein